MTLFYTINKSAYGLNISGKKAFKPNIHLKEMYFFIIMIDNEKNIKHVQFVI